MKHFKITRNNGTVYFVHGHSSYMWNVFVSDDKAVDVEALS